MDFDDAPKMIMGAAGIVLVMILAAFLLYAAIAVGAVVLLYQAYIFYRDHPATQARRNRKQASALYEAILVAQQANAFPRADVFRELVSQDLVSALGDRLPSSDLASCMLTTAEELYQREGFTDPPPLPQPDSTRLELARAVDALSSRLALVSRADAADLARETIVGALVDFCRCLPAMAFQEAEKVKHAIAEKDVAAAISVSLLETLAQPGLAIETLILPFYSERVIAAGLFAQLRGQLDRDQHLMSEVPYLPEHYQSPKLINPKDHAGTPFDLVDGYLRHTPLQLLFAAELPFAIPETIRFEHHWIVAGSGHGKTQALQHLIATDFARVAEGEASVIVIDSQGDLIHNLAGLELFAPGEPLAGRLCLIDPADVEYPVALNLFDVGLERLKNYGELDREWLMNGVVELYDFVLSSLLSAEFTSKQSIIFRYLTRLMLQIPGATIHTLRELLAPDGIDKYRHHLDALDKTTREFFASEFNSKQFDDTKSQVLRRLWALLGNKTFERMFSHPKSKLDLFAEMNGGRVILINTAKELLKQQGAQILGRFFIALIAQAAQERATLAKERRLPTFVYLDECADYLDDDVALILEQARKFHVGMVLAHQYTGQLTPKLFESFAANTSIKFAGGVSDKDARLLAHLLRCTPEFILGQPKGNFAASVRNLTAAAISLRIPLGQIETRPRMADEEWAQVRDEMRARYATPYRGSGEACPSPRGRPLR